MKPTNGGEFTKGKWLLVTTLISLLFVPALGAPVLPGDVQIDKNLAMEKRHGQPVVIISHNQQPTILFGDASGYVDEDYDDSSDQVEDQSGIDDQSGVDDHSSEQEDSRSDCHHEDVDNDKQDDHDVELQSGQDRNDFVGPHLLILGVPAGTFQKRNEELSNGVQSTMEKVKGVDVANGSGDEALNTDISSEDGTIEDEEKADDALAVSEDGETPMIRRRFIRNMLATGAGVVLGNAISDHWRAKKAKKEKKKNRHYDDDDDGKVSRFFSNPEPLSY